MMSQLNKQITRNQGIGLLATTLLGTGVFILPQLTVSVAGYNALYSWSGLTIAILPIVWAFAKLASLYSHAAGPAYFVEQAFGSQAGRVIGLLFVCAVPIGAAAAMMMVMEFMQLMFEFSATQAFYTQLLLLFSIWLLNIKGIKLSATIQLTLTLLITALVIVLIGAFSIDSPLPSSDRASPIDVSLVLVAASIAFWSFLGIEAVSHFSAEFKNPQQDFVPAMLIGTLLVGLLYIACVWLVLAQPESEESAMVSAFDYLFSQGGRWAIGILGVTAGLATINVYVGGVARLCWSLANESVMPKFLSTLNQHQVPQNAANTVTLVMALVIVCQFILGISFEIFLSWTNGVFVVIYAASMLAACKLLAKKYLLASLCGLTTCLAIGIGLAENMLYAFSVALVIYPLVALQSKRHQRKSLVGLKQ